MTTNISPTPKLQFFDANGNPLSGGKVYTYAAGTTTPQTTYTDYAGGTPNTNPVILDSRGEASVWLSSAQYKFKLTSSTDVEIWTVDNLGGAATMAQLEASSGASLIGFIQTGSGAATRSVQAKLRDTINALDFTGVDPTGVTDSTAGLQAALTAAAGKMLVVPDGNYLITAMLTMSTAGSSLVLANNASITYNTPNYAALKITAAKCRVSGGLGGGFVGPASWDGANTTPTYGVIWITGNNCQVQGVRLYNVRKLGVWAKDVEDCTVEDCLIEGNYPSASWTGTETGHWGVLFDPYTGDSGGNFKLLNNTIKTCVQGCQPGNYGTGGVVRGFEAVGNIFESCWNHGIYSNFTNGATITGNSFNRCQIPVVISGNNNVVSGNSMHTATVSIGDQRDITGISIRDGSFNSVTGNTIRGVLSPPGNVVCINLQDVNGTGDLVDNIIANNTIELGAGAGVAIRIQTSSQVARGNLITGNTIKAPGVSTEGLISVYGYSGKVGGSITAATQANPGVITTASAHGLSVNDLVWLLDVQGMTQLNGRYKVNSTPTTTSFTVKSITTGTPTDTSGFSAYTSGGEVRLLSKQSTGNKVSNNTIVATSKTFGIYMTYQTEAAITNNSIEYQYSASSPETIPAIALFDCYVCAAINNLNIVAPTYGTNVSIQGFREYSGTVTQQLSNNITINNIDQVSTTSGAYFQAVESLAGSGLIIQQSAAYAPTTACAVGSMWLNTAGSVNDTLYVKQYGTAGDGWTPMGVGTVNASATDIASKTASINTTSKYTGKLVWDTTNSRELRALGSTDVSGWRVIDGSATVTPS